MKLILIKLGGSLITNKAKPFSEDLKTIKRLASEIHEARMERNSLFIVGHGGGSYPHVPAVKYQTDRGVINEKSFRGIAEVQDAASRLNRIVVRELINTGEDAVSISPSSFMFAEGGEIKKAFLPPLLKCLEFKMLPVVYGDVVLDTQRGCCILSTEKILNFLADKLKSKFKVDRVIQCGRTNGVYDKEGRTIPKINIRNFNRIQSQIGSSEGIDVTGGMLHKVEESLILAKKGTPSVIINGTKEGELLNVLLRESHKGTEVSWGVNFK